MNRLSVIPGHVTKRTLRALIITPEPGVPTATAARKRFPSKSVGNVVVSAVEMHPDLENELGRRGLKLFLAKVDVPLPGEEYILRVDSGSLQRRVEFRTLLAGSQGESVKMVVASCFYRYYHLDSAYRAALRSAYCRDASFKILMGDNLYLDVAEGQMFAGGAYEETVQRYVSYFHETGYSDVLSCLPTLTTYDDHEFWNNYPERQVHLSRTWDEDTREEYKAAGIQAVGAFQSLLNPQRLTQSDFSFIYEDPRPVSIFVADVRSGRAPYAGDATPMLGEDTLGELITWANDLQKPGVLVLGQPLLMGRGNWMDYNPPDFVNQYEAIVDAIHQAPHDILVVAGDVHFSRLASFGMPGGRTLHEFVCSPACHIPVPLVGGQDRTNPTVPGEVRTEAGKRISLRLQDYLFGTGAPNCIGVLNFTRVRDGSVVVGAQVLNLQPGGSRPPSPAKAERIDVVGGGRRVPLYDVCSSMNFVNLK